MIVLFVHIPAPQTTHPEKAHFQRLVASRRKWHRRRRMLRVRAWPKRMALRGRAMVARSVFWRGAAVR